MKDLFEFIARGVATGMTAKPTKQKQNLAQAEAAVKAAAERRAKKMMHQASGIKPLPEPKKKNQICQDEVLRRLGGKQP